VRHNTQDTGHRGGRGIPSLSEACKRRRRLEPWGVRGGKERKMVGSNRPTVGYLLPAPLGQGTTTILRTTSLPCATWGRVRGQQEHNPQSLFPLSCPSDVPVGSMCLIAPSLAGFLGMSQDKLKDVYLNAVLEIWVGIRKIETFYTQISSYTCCSITQTRPHPRTLPTNDHETSSHIYETSHMPRALQNNRPTRTNPAQGARATTSTPCPRERAAEDARDPRRHSQHQQPTPDKRKPTRIRDDIPPARKSPATSHPC
jgi:hypothetical protein